MGVFNLRQLCLGTNIAFQKVHGVVIPSEPKDQWIHTKPLEHKSSCHTANQDVEKSFSICNKTSRIFGIDEPTEEHANVKEGVQYAPN